MRPRPVFRTVDNLPRLIVGRILSSVKYLLLYLCGLLMVLQPQKGVADDARVIETLIPSNTFEVLNPERGIFRFRPLTKTSNFSAVRSTGSSLVYSEIDLASFKQSPISRQRLDDIDLAFQSIRASGLKTILRIVYAHAIGESDAAFVRIEEHLQQLAPILERHRAVIFAVQAGCIGPWGEWHSSVLHRDNPMTRAQLIELLLKEIPRGITIHVRRPSFKREALALLSDESAAARIGHHNDCFLADQTDAGTYSSPSNAAEERKYLSQESLLVPFGGETCRNTPELTSCDSALRSMLQVGMTYLNGDYHPEVLSGFVHHGCWPVIRRSLGYRIEIRSVRFEESIDGRIVGELALENVGWAPLYSNRPITVTLRRANDNVVLLQDATANHRGFAPGTTTKLHFQLDRSAIKGTSAMTLAMPDGDPSLQSDSRYAIRIPNALGWNEASGTNVVIDNLESVLLSDRNGTDKRAATESHATP